MLDAHFIAGDGRVNENIGLTAIHQIFHSEHDRLVDDIENVLTTDTSGQGRRGPGRMEAGAGADGWNGERLFQAARFITEMEYQHLVFEEFARKIQPAINPFEPFAFTQTEINPAVKAEFAHAVYRFGHSMLTETISRRNEDGAGHGRRVRQLRRLRGSQNDISLLEGFLNPPAYTDGGPAGAARPRKRPPAASSWACRTRPATNWTSSSRTRSATTCWASRSTFATINMTRARSEGIPTLNVLRRELFTETNDGQLKPYTNWVDFGENLKHPESLVNFVAAYGQHHVHHGAPPRWQAKRAGRDGCIVSPDASPATFPRLTLRPS